MHHLSKKHSRDMQSSWISFDTFAISATNTSEPGQGWRMIARALERKIDSIMASFSLILNETVASNRELLGELRSRFLDTNSTAQLLQVNHQREQRELQREMSAQIFEQNPANVHDSKDLMNLIRKYNENNMNEYYRSVDKLQATQNETQFNAQPQPRGSIQERMVKIYQDLDALLKENSIEFGQNNKSNRSSNQNTKREKATQNTTNTAHTKQQYMKTVVPDGSEGKSFLNLYLKACQWTTIPNPTSLPLCPCIPSQLGKLLVLGSSHREGLFAFVRLRSSSFYLYIFSTWGLLKYQPLEVRLYHQGSKRAKARGAESAVATVLI